MNAAGVTLAKALAETLAGVLAGLAATVTTGLSAPMPGDGVDAARLMQPDPAPNLQAYHLFVGGDVRTPVPDLIPYSLNTPLFTDHAQKARLLHLPPGTALRYAGAGLPDFPVGSVLVKTFSYPADLRAPTIAVRPVETRLLIRKPEGWVASTYVWNAAGTDAVLKRAGTRIAIHVVDRTGQPLDIDYGVPNVNQCKTCHSVDGRLSPIGPKARNLNGPLDHGPGAENQLTHLSRIGVLTGAPAAASIPRTAVWDDLAEPLPERARAYLDVNCGHCHNPQGFAGNSGLFLDLEQKDMSAVGVGKRPVAAGRASGGMDFAIAPGDPDHSIIVHRMASTEPGVMMPQLGRSLVHAEGLALVRAYVAAMGKGVDPQR